MQSVNLGKPPILASGNSSPEAACMILALVTGSRGGCVGKLGEVACGGEE